ncbi:7798_t:CDS:10, partial [Funneliformis mosseae]
MLLQQISSGKSNGFVQSFHTAYWENSRYIVYGTGNKLVIYNGFSELIQTIDASEFLKGSPNQDKIFSTEISEFDGKIAITIGTNVLIFKPIQNKHMKVQWSLLEILEHNYPTFCTSWSLINGQLLVGGGAIVLWEQDKSGEDNHNKWTKIWEQRVASNIIHAEISPDSTLFATVGEYDRLVKIWCCPQGDYKDWKSKFHYLPHPRSVTNLSWRKGPIEQINSQGSNILLTVCKDGICRIWAATNPEEPHNLYICTVVDPEQSLVTLPSSEEERICHGDPDCYSPIHWIHPREFLISLKLAIDSFDSEKEQTQIGAGLKKLKDLANDTPDLLYQIQKDGSMVIWGIRNVYCRPRRIPKVLVLLRASQALPPSNAEYFHGSTFVFHDNTSSDFKSTSVELTILAQSPQGRINKYSTRLVEVFENLSPLQLKYSWSGHRDHVKTIIKSPGTDCFVSLTNDGKEAILWDITKPDISQLVEQIGPKIIEKAPVYVDSQIKLACVLSDEFLAAYDGTRIELFMCGSNCDNFHKTVVFDDYDASYELLLLFTYQHKTTTTSFPTYVVGVSSKKNTVFCWTFSYEGHTGPIINFVSKTCLPIDSQVTMAISVEQWAGSNIRRYPSENLSPPILLTYSDEGYIRYWQANMKYNSDDPNNDKVLWMEEVVFDIGKKKNTVLIKCGPQGKAAEKENGYELTIWECITKRLPPAKDFIEGFSEKIVDIDWLFTSNAEIVLAVSTSQKIYIYTQLRKHHVSERGSWIMFSEIDKPCNVALPISAISWGSGGSLIVANCNQFRCYNKWLTEESNKKVSSITGIIQKDPTLFHVVDHLNGPLPHHHPTLLLQHILWGKMDLVKQILAHLYKFLKILIGSNKPIKRLLPLPFDKLFQAQDETPKPSTKTRRYSSLFGEDSDEEGSQETLLEFTEETANFLSEQLKVISLPDLSHVEQAQLLALIDTINQVEHQKRSLDENGVRYVLFMRRYHYLNRYKLSSGIRTPGLNYRDMNWALHSDSQDLLIEYSIQASGGKFLWKDARIHGIFLWLRSNESVRQQFENVARNHYMSKEERDPTDSSLFYMALRKKKLLLGLWRTANAHKEQTLMLKFLVNDFTEPRWKTAALKNAYALLGKQRYEYAAAFFLLGDRLKDAVNVCLKHLDDFQLAIAIARVYEGEEGPVLKSIYEDHVIPLAIRTGDRWLASLAFWSLNQRDKAVKAIMVPLETLCDHKIESTPLTTDSPDAALIVLYKQLKDKSIQTLRGAAEISFDKEYFFVLRSIFAYDRMGCPLLALYLVQTWTFSPQSDPERPDHILKSRRRTTIFDIPLAASDDVISKGVVNFDTWSWDAPLSPVSPISVKHITDKAEDIFSDEPSPMVSPITPKRISFTDTTFKDSSDDNNVWGWDSPRHYQKVNSFKAKKTDIFAEKISKNDIEKDSENITLLDDIDFYDYKVSLVKRLCQQLLDAVMTFQEEPELFEQNTYYNDYVSRVEQGLATICENVKVPMPDIKELLISYPLYNEIYQINHLEFYQNNTKLISGDAEGIIIIWDMNTMRPTLQFKAHNEGILRCLFLNNKLISHGRDNLLKLWKIDRNSLNDDKRFISEEKIVEIKDDDDEPKLEKCLSVNSLNFCKFDYCFKGDNDQDILIALPSSKGSAAIDVWNLSNQQRILGFDGKQETEGYCMAIKFFQHPTNKSEYLILSAYENGGVILWSFSSDKSNDDDVNEELFSERLWSVKQHKETVLALDVSKNRKFAISTAGDKKIVKYNFNENFEKEPLINSITIKSAGIADIKIRSDSKIFATAGWDSKIRVFSSKTMKPLAILSYHKESVYSLAFAHVFSQEDNDNTLIENEIDERVLNHFLVGGGKDRRVTLWEIY